LRETRVRVQFPAPDTDLFWYVTNQPPKANSAFYPSEVGKWVRSSASLIACSMCDNCRRLQQLGDGELPTVSDGNVQLLLCQQSTNWSSSCMLLITMMRPVYHRELYYVHVTRWSTAWTTARPNPGDTVACYSVDSVAEVDQQAVYPTEYIRTFSHSVATATQTQH